MGTLALQITALILVVAALIGLCDFLKKGRPSSGGRRAVQFCERAFLLLMGMGVTGILCGRGWDSELGDVVARWSAVMAVLSLFGIILAMAAELLVAARR